MSVFFIVNTEGQIPSCPTTKNLDKKFIRVERLWNRLLPWQFCHWIHLMWIRHMNGSFWKFWFFFSLADWQTHSLLGLGPKHNSISIYGLMKNVNSCNGRFYVYKGFLFATSCWKFLKVILWKSNNIVCFAMVITCRKTTHSLSTIQSE